VLAMKKDDIEKTAVAVVDKWIKIEKKNRINHPEICQTEFDDVIYFRQLLEEVSERSDYSMVRFISDRDFAKTYTLALQLFMPAFMNAMRR
jgi:hypothetical protein